MGLRAEWGLVGYRVESMWSRSSLPAGGLTALKVCHSADDYSNLISEKETINFEVNVCIIWFGG